MNLTAEHSEVLSIPKIIGADPSASSDIAEGGITKDQKQVQLTNY